MGAVAVAMIEGLGGRRVGAHLKPNHLRPALTCDPLDVGKKHRSQPFALALRNNGDRVEARAQRSLAQQHDRAPAKRARVIDGGENYGVGTGEQIEERAAFDAVTGKSVRFKIDERAYVR